MATVEIHFLRHRAFMRLCCSFWAKYSWLSLQTTSAHMNTHSILDRLLGAHLHRGWEGYMLVLVITPCVNRGCVHYCLYVDNGKSGLVHSYHAFPQVKCKSRVLCQSFVGRAFNYKGTCRFDLWWRNDAANFKRCHCHYWSTWLLTENLCYLNICQASTEVEDGTSWNL